MKKTFAKSISVILIILTLLNSFGMVSIAADDTDLNFDSVAVRADKGIVVYFIVDKAKLAGYDSFYMSYSKDGGDAVKVESYDEIGDRYYFPCNDIAAKEMGSKISATLTATKDGQSTTGVAYEYSVSDYCYGVLNDTSSAQWEKQLAASMLLYGAEAQKYFDYKEDALVTAIMTDAQKAMAPSVDKTTLSSVYENQPKDSSVAITGATIEHGASPRLVVQLVENGEEALAGLSVNFAWNGGSAAVAGDELKNIDGKLYAYLDELTIGDMSETITITAFRGRAPIANTVKYSLASYIAEKKDDAEVSAIALALFAYGKAVADMPAEAACQFGHTNISETEIDSSYNLTMDSKCTVCGHKETIEGKGYSASQLYDMESASPSTYGSTYDAGQVAWKKTFQSGNDKYFFIINRGNSNETGIKNIPFTNGYENPYVAVCVKGTGTVTIRPNGANNTTVTLTDEWQTVVIPITNKNSLDYLRSVFFDLDETIYINSIAVFKSEAEARAYTGAFGHAYVTTTNVGDNYDLTVDSKCAVCGKETGTFTGKAFTADNLIAFKETDNARFGTDWYSWTKNESMNAAEFKLTANGTSDNSYLLLRGLSSEGAFSEEDNRIDLNEYKYMVVYMQSSCDVKLGFGWATSLRSTFAESNEWKSWVIETSDAITDSGSTLAVLKFCPQEWTQGTTLLINSIAFFKTAEEAQAFAGIGLN